MKGLLDSVTLSLEGSLKDATRTYIDESISVSLARFADTMEKIKAKGLGKWIHRKDS